MEQPARGGHAARSENGGNAILGGSSMVKCQCKDDTVVLFLQSSLELYIPLCEFLPAKVLRIIPRTAAVMSRCPRRAESNLISEQLEDRSVVKSLFLSVINPLAPEFSLKF